jgi:predicted amidohydrolase
VAVLRLALLQLAAGANQQENLIRGLEACGEAAAGGADLALFPEMWQIGYSPCPEDPAARQAWQDQSISPDDLWLQAFRDQANRLGMAIVVTYLQRGQEAPRNAALLIDRTGRSVSTYAKVHTCDFSAEAALCPGSGFGVATLDTRHGPLQVGMMICYDREFPESARVLMLRGAELIVTPNACELGPDRIGQFRARAFENMVAVAMANYPAPQFDGRSCAFDGMAFRPDGTNRDHTLVLAGPEPGIVYADIDLTELRDYRRRETWGDAYRKPYAYGPLLDVDAPAPFVRPDARRAQPNQDSLAGDG